MNKEKQVSIKDGILDVQLVYPEASEQQAKTLIKIWNNNEGVEYDDNQYDSFFDWLNISKTNGYSLEDMLY